MDPVQSRHVALLSPARSYQASSGIGRRHGLTPTMATPRLFATSDLHVAHPANWLIVEDLRGRFEQDWLIVAGDVAESVDDLRWTLHRLRDRFAKVIWAPGNHELYTLPGDPLQLRGEARYRHLVELCRGLDVVTPEDPYPVWDDGDEQLVVAPLLEMYRVWLG